MSQAPVILLAFANEQQAGHGGHLRALSSEMRAVRNALWEAEGKGLCEVKILANASVQDIWDAFTQTEFGSRISIFHYSGHADSYALLLEAVKAQQNQLADGQGLADFLASRPRLQLVFLNACATRKHADELLARGMNGVIATSRSVKDKIAAGFSARFYQSLAKGLPLMRAFLDAKSEAETLAGKADPSATRKMTFTPKEVEDLFAWEFYLRQGAESLRNWNLPDEVRNPFFDLPDLPTRKQDLPQTPYPNLHWYTQQDAEIFFGRGYEIRDLFIRMTDAESPGVILLYGASGVGKSSLLDAGLLPRLEQIHEVKYERRNEQASLIDTLAGLLANNAENLTSWLEIENNSGKPLTIIFDQLEEVFTRPNEAHSDEAEDFVIHLKQLYQHKEASPEGKLILSMRKEYLAEWEDLLNMHQVAYAKVFIKPLGKEGVLEAIRGIYDTDALQRHYQLEIEKNLPEEIAADLLRNTGDTAIAPTLQILLFKLWKEAKRRNPDTPLFSRSLYRELKNEGLLLSDFLDQQLNSLERAGHDLGLMLDVLHFHTTNLSTAHQHNLKTSEQRYAHILPVVLPLMSELEDHYLLIRGECTADGTPTEPFTRLAHDTLAPLIIKLYNESVAPAQWASRVLDSRLLGLETSESLNMYVLDSKDLKQVQAGRKFMRSWSESEAELVRLSKVKVQKQERNRKWVLGIIGGLILLVGVVGLSFLNQNRQYRQTVGDLGEAQDSLKQLDESLAETQQLITSREQSLAIKEEELKEKDSLASELDQQLVYSRSLTADARGRSRANQAAVDALAWLRQGNRYKAISLAVKAYRAAPEEAATQSALLNIWHDRLPVFLPYQSESYPPLITDKVNEAGDSLFVKGGNIQIKYGLGKETFEIDAPSFIRSASFLEGMSDRVYVWLGDEKQIAVYPPSPYLIKSRDLKHLLVDATTQEIVVGTQNGQIRRINLNDSRQVPAFSSRSNSPTPMFVGLAVSRNGKYYAGGSADRIDILSKENELPITLPTDDPGKSFEKLRFGDHNSDFLLAARSLGTVTIWNWKESPNTPIVSLITNDSIKSRIRDAVFPRDGKWVISGDVRGNLRIWEWERNRLDTQWQLPSQAAIQSLAFSPDGKWLAIAAADNHLYLYPWPARFRSFNENLLISFEHRGPVNDVEFFQANNGKLYVATASSDQSARYFELTNHRLTQLLEFNTGALVRHIAFSADGKFLLIANQEGLRKPVLLDGDAIIDTLIHKQIIP